MTTAAADLPRRLHGPDRLTRFGEPPRFAEGLWQVGPQAYAWMVPNGSWGETNLGLVVCGDRSVLVDTCWDLAYTREMLDAAQPVLRAAPIEYVINTHADGDHCWGNQFFRDKHIIGTQACVDQMHHLRPQTLHALKHGGRVLRRLPFTRLDKFGHYMAGMFAPYDFRDIAITPPNDAFRGKRVLQVGQTEVHLLEVGPGHTDGDAIVHVPEQGVAYAGDILFVGVTPVMWAGPLVKLILALERLTEMRAKVIVPGHGPLANLSDVRAVLDYWNFIHDELHRRYTIDMPPYEAAREVALSAAFQSSPFAQWDSPERIVTNAYTLYRHWGAKLKSLPGKLGVMELMRQQAELAFSLPAARPAVMRRKP